MQDTWYYTIAWSLQILRDGYRDLWILSRINHINYVICDSIYISMLLMLRWTLDLYCMFRVWMGCNLISCIVARANRDYTGCWSQFFFKHTIPHDNSPSWNFYSFISQIRIASLLLLYKLRMLLDQYYFAIRDCDAIWFNPAQNTQRIGQRPRLATGYCSLIFNFESGESAQVRELGLYRVRPNRVLAIASGDARITWHTLQATGCPALQRQWPFFDGEREREDRVQKMTMHYCTRRTMRLECVASLELTRYVTGLPSQDKPGADRIGILSKRLLMTCAGGLHTKNVAMCAFSEEDR